MRTISLRACVLFLMGLFAVVLATECGGGILPTDPTPRPSTPSANVHVLGNLSFPSCTADGSCTYQGLIVNDGPDCAKNIRGVTHLFDASGNEIEAQQWNVAGRMRIAGPELFSGCCFSSRAVNTQGTYRTEVFFEAMQCI